VCWLRTGSAAIARDMILRLHLKSLPFFLKEKTGEMPSFAGAFDFMMM